MCGPHVVQRGPGVVVVRVIVSAVGRNHLPDAINEGGINQMSCILKEEEEEEHNETL